MKKEELVNIISSRLSSQGKETAVAFDVFLQKVAESLEVNQSVKIPEVGIFQLKRKGALDEPGSQGKGSFYLLFVPLKYTRKDKNEVLAFQVNPRNIKKAEIDDDVFSLSVDQPVIPVTEQARREFLVHSSYLMMQKNYEDRVDSLLSNSVNLSDFEIDYNFSSAAEENSFSTPMEAETKNEDNESIPWDFGEEDNLINNLNTPETPQETKEEDFDSVVAQITGDLSNETPDIDDLEEFPEEKEITGIPEENDLQSETEEVLNHIMPEDKLNLTDDLFNNLLGEDEIQEEDGIREDEAFKPSLDFNASAELGEDWFSLKEIDEEEEETSEIQPEEAEGREEAFAEAAFASDEPSLVDDQAENIDEKLELLTEMDAGLEIDPFEEFPVSEEDLKPEEESLTDELPLEVPLEEEKPAEDMPEPLPEENVLPGISITDDKFLEDEDESDEHKEKYPKAFWMILGALVLVTLGGVYYFFFMGKHNPLLPDFAQKKNTEITQAVKPQVIERDYSVPVTVYKRSTENPQELQKAGNEAASAEDENKTAPENTAPKTEATQTLQEKKPETRQQLTNAPAANGTNPQAKTNTQVNKPVQKNNSVVNNTPVPKQNQAQTDYQVQPRSDTKDKLIKQDIFTDGRGRYTIQESSWQSSSEAVKRVKYFKSLGLDAYYTKYAPKGAKVWYRVRIGDFPSLEETEKTLKRIK